jgi:hypothetical protein
VALTIAATALATALPIQSAAALHGLSNVQRAAAGWTALQRHPAVHDGLRLYREQYPVQSADNPYRYERPFPQVRVTAPDLSGMPGAAHSGYRQDPPVADAAQPHYWDAALEAEDIPLDEHLPAPNKRPAQRPSRPRRHCGDHRVVVQAGRARRCECAAVAGIGDFANLQQAKRIGAAALRHFGRDSRLIKQPPYFTFIFFANLLLQSVGPGDRYPSAMRVYADAVWATHRDPRTGLFHLGSEVETQTLDQAAMTQIYALLDRPRSRYGQLY